MEEEKALVAKLASFGIQCDQAQAKAFLEEPKNRKVIDSDLLPWAFESFLEKQKLKEEATIAKEEATIAKEEATIAKEKANKAEALVAQADMASFLDRQLPPLMRGSGVSTSNVADAKHADATLTVKTADFGLLSDQQLPMENKVASVLKVDINKGTGSLIYSTEATIVNFVKAVLQEALMWLGQDLQFQQEYGLAAVRPDLVVILGLHGLPVGAIEVKLPNKDPALDQDDPMNVGRMHGQLLDYLLILKHVHGVDNPLGIACTYQSWRFCWLPGSEAFVRMTKKVEPPPTQEPLVAGVSALSLMANQTLKLKAVPILGTQGPPFQEPSKDELLANRDTSKIAREMHGTRVLSYDDRELNRHIVSFLHKLTSSSASPRGIKVGHFYPRLKDDEFDWDELLTEPIPGTFPPSQTKNFWLLRELGAGQEGKAWEATTRSGATCAVKIFDRNASLETATRRRDQELQIWHEVWEMGCVFPKVLVKKPALIMPLVLTAPSFGKNLPRDLPPDLLDATLKALARLDECNYGNDDLRWDHVGFYKENERGKWCYKAVMLDIKPIKKTKDTLEKMKRDLGLA